MITRYILVVILFASLIHFPCQAAQQQRSIPPREWTHFPVWSNSGHYVAVTWPAPDMMKADGTIVRIEKTDSRPLRGPVATPASALPQHKIMPGFLCNFDRRKTLILDGKTFQQRFPPIPTYLYNICWSPDDELLAGQDGREHRGVVYEPKTGKLSFKIPAKFTAQPDCYVWSPDGKCLAVSQMTEVEIWDVTKRRVALTLPTIKDVWQKKISWSTDGNQIAVVGSKQKGDSQIGEMQVCNALDGKSVLQKQSKIGVGQALWTKDGKYLIYSDEALHFLKSTTLKEEFHLITEGNDGPISFSLSPNQKFVAYKGCDSLLHIFDLISKSHVRAIQGDKSGNFSFLWTPDSESILLKNNTNMVALCNVIRGNFEGAKQLEDFALNWTPDGKSLVRTDSQTDAIVLEPCDLSKRTIGKSVLPDGNLENPWKDQRIPRNLEDCFVELDKFLGPQQVERLKKTPEDGLCAYTGGIGLGMQLRNLWGLRGHTPLVKYFNSYGITHGATMSELIIECYWKKLNSMPIDLRAEVEGYDTKWERRMEKYSKQKKE